MLHIVRLKEGLNIVLSIVQVELLSFSSMISLSLYLWKVHTRRIRENLMARSYLII